jgi:Na+/H+ antiporter NhaD/arsenite permease-like protein
MASNIGSAATITGNPQSMMIGSFWQIPYAQFTASLAPVTPLPTTSLAPVVGRNPAWTKVPVDLGRALTTVRQY